MGNSAGRAIAILSIVVLPLTSCAREHANPADASDKSSVPASSAGYSVDEKAVIEVYKKYFETMLALGSADEAKIRADLAPYAEGKAIDNVVASMARFRSKNLQPAGKMVFSALIVSVSGDAATVRECHDGAAEVMVDSTTGAVISAGGVVGIEAQLVRQNQTWLMISYDQVEGIC